MEESWFRNLLSASIDNISPPKAPATEGRRRRVIFFYLSFRAYLPKGQYVHSRQ